MFAYFNLVISCLIVVLRPCLFVCLQVSYTSVQTYEPTMGLQGSWSRESWTSLTSDSLELSSPEYDSSPSDGTLSGTSIIPRDTCTPSLDDSDVEDTPMCSSPRKSTVRDSRRSLNRRQVFRCHQTSDSSDTSGSVEMPYTVKDINQGMMTSPTSSLTRAFIPSVPTNTPDTSYVTDNSCLQVTGNNSFTLGKRPPCIGAEAKVTVEFNHSPCHSSRGRWYWAASVRSYTQYVSGSGGERFVHYSRFWCHFLHGDATRPPSCHTQGQEVYHSPYAKVWSTATNENSGYIINDCLC